MRKLGVACLQRIEANDLKPGALPIWFDQWDPEIEVIRIHIVDGRIRVPIPVAR
jgi:hypothetical protein